MGPTARYDIHPPFRLCTTHPKIGALGFVLPGTNIETGSPMVAAASPSRQDSANETLDIRLAKTENSGVVHRVVLTCGNDGYILTGQGCHTPGMNNLLYPPGSSPATNILTHTPIRPEHIRIAPIARAPPLQNESLTIRITTVSLREPRVGDFSVT